jgi:biofilm PGA synthesis N-glycosyltransferase PgaC
LFEIIIIDDNSSDNTFKLAASFSGIKNLRVIKNAGTGKKLAIRTGVKTASGKLIITTDADCRMGRRWLSGIASFCSENNPDLVICPVMTESNPGFFGPFQELEFLSLQGITAGTAAAGNPVMCNGANMAFTKESYIKNSDDLHYELISGDDVFLLHSIKKEPGSKILWLESENAVVTTVAPETINLFLKQRARWISKAGSYSDRFTRVLAIVTFVTILLQMFLLIAGIFNPVFLLIFLAALALKSAPDFLILLNTTSRYGKSKLMRWFLPSQIIYPFYMFTVSVYSLMFRGMW